MEKKKLHLVNSLAIFKDLKKKKKKDLGSKDLSTINKTPFDKRWWKFTSKRDMLWRKLISENFGKEPGGWCS